MDAHNFERLVASHTENLRQVVDALKAQGHDISMTIAGDCIFLVHVKPQQTINEAFYLDNREALARMQRFTSNLRSQIVVPPSGQGSPFLTARATA